MAPAAAKEDYGRKFWCLSEEMLNAKAGCQHLIKELREKTITSIDGIKEQLLL
jgi:hypothetical protein